ncbi:unnamed protein product [Arctogadus glacialis]
MEERGEERMGCVFDGAAHRVLPPFLPPLSSPLLSSPPTSSPLVEEQEAFLCPTLKDKGNSYHADQVWKWWLTLIR